MLQKIRGIENSHIILWLIKDTFWVLDYKIPGMIMIVPTVAVALYLCYISRHDAKEFFHSLAVCFWIAANGSWMIGEFYFNDSLRPLAFSFFILGLLSISFYYIRISFSKKS